MNPFTTRWGLLVTALTLIAVGGAIVLVVVPAPPTPIQTATTTPTTTGEASSTGDLSDLIVVTSPKPGATISSTTVTVTGEARGTWYFEASFPVALKNASGAVIAQGPAQAQSDWMTNNFVPFVITLTYPAQPAGSHGTLVLKNDNPSGDLATQKELDIPVTF